MTTCTFIVVNDDMVLLDAEWLISVNGQGVQVKSYAKNAIRSGHFESVWKIHLKFET